MKIFFYIFGIIITGFGSYHIHRVSENFPIIKGKYPSNNEIFTQGIYYTGGYFVISSGAPEYFPKTHSRIGILEKNGNFSEKIRENRDIFFGEGITKLWGKIFWTFWKNKKIFVYDTKNFQKIQEFEIPGEWWWLTTDGKSLILSDGSNIITFLHPENGKILRHIFVRENGKIINKINELEYIRGYIFANIWLTNDIIIINPKNGEVIKRWNLENIANNEKKDNPITQEMNGIAFDEEKNEIIITGKMWKNLYRIDTKNILPSL